MLDELRKLGFSEGRNLSVEYRSIEQESRAVFADAAELVRSNADVLVAVGPEAGLQAALAASSTIPIVIVAFNYDPIARGYVKGLAQAGGNITGVFLRQPELAEKQVEILTQAFPEKTRLAMLWDALSADQFSAAENRAKLLHLHVLSMKLERPPYDFDAAFRSLAESTPQLLLVLSSPHFIAHRERFAQLAIKHRLPAMNTFKFYVEAGGLMSYGVDTVLPFRRAGFYIAKILQGPTPPVSRSNRLRSSRWRLTSRLRRLSGSSYQHLFCCALTRSSSDPPGDLLTQGFALHSVGLWPFSTECTLRNWQSVLVVQRTWMDGRPGPMRRE